VTSRGTLLRASSLQEYVGLKKKLRRVRHHFIEYGETSALHTFPTPQDSDCSLFCTFQE
jgi:hypothetical protein